jgi:uncharacterized sodium:solute symporter family permease YidK
MIQMAYPDGADLVNQTIPVVWTGLLNGLLDGTTASTQNRIVSGIDQCFEQSPYIIRSN